MKTLKKQSIAQALRENFAAYPEDYPVSDGGPSEDAISQLISWVENEYQNDEEEDRGTIDEWFEIAISSYLDYFDRYFDNENESGENREYVVDQINFLRKR
jgi:hypothetical protein